MFTNRSSYTAVIVLVLSLRATCEADATKFLKCYSRKCIILLLNALTVVFSAENAPSINSALLEYRTYRIPCNSLLQRLLNEMQICDADASQVQASSIFNVKTMPGIATAPYRRSYKMPHTVQANDACNMTHKQAFWYLGLQSRIAKCMCIIRVSNFL